MTDKLKKFIQQYRSGFDIEEPRADLFNKIMGSVESDKIENKKVRKFKPPYAWMAAAASILLVVCAMIFYEPEKQTQEAVSSNNEPASGKNQNNTATSNTASQETNEHLQTKKLNSTAIITTKPSIEKTIHVENGKRSYSELVELERGKRKTESGKSGSRNVIESEIKSSENNVATHECIVIQNPSEHANQQNATPPVNPQILNQQTVAENITTTSQQINTDNTPALTNNEIIAQPKEEKKTIDDVITNDEDESIADEDADKNNSLGSVIKKGFFSFLSKKAKKWSGNTLTIENIESEKESVLAVHFKNERVEFSRDIKLAAKD
jgi:hypothetical protein